MALKETALNIVLKLKDLTKKGLGKFKKDIKDTDETAEKASTGGIKRLTTAIGGLVTAAVGFAVIKKGITSVLQTGDKFEKLAIQMRAVMGSIEEGDQATEWIKEFTTKTPLQLENTTDAFLKLKNFGLDPMDGTLQAIVDQNEKLGGGQERLAGISNALGQAWAKQKLQGEEVLQLVERGVPVYELLAKVTGKNGEALADMQANGELTRDVIKQLIVEMGEASTGAAAANMSTMSGLVSNLKDSWTNFLNAIAQSGALDAFKDQLTEVANKLKQLTDNGSLQRWAKSASDGIVGLFGTLRSLAGIVYDARGAIELFVKAWLGLKLASLVSGIGRLAGTIGGALVPGVRTATVNVRALGVAMKGLVWGLLIEGALQVASAFRELSAAKEELNKALEAKADVEEEAAERLRAYNEATGETITSLDTLLEIVESGAAIFDAANQKWITGADAVDEFKASLDKTGQSLESVTDKAGEELQTAIDGVIAGFRTAATDADTTQDALEDLFSNYELGALDDLQALAGGMQQLKEAGELTDEEIKSGLQATLEGMTANEITAFSIALESAFQAGTDAAESFAIFADATVGAALAKLKVDVVELETGISAVGTEAISSFQLVVDGIKDSGLAADKAGDAIVASYVAAFKSVKTEAGQAQLLAGLQEALDLGIITFAEFQKAIDAAAGSTDAAANSFSSLADGIRKAKEKLDEVETSGGNAGDAVAKGAEGASSATALLSAAISGFTQQLQDMSDGAREAFEQTALGMEAPGTEAEALVDRLKAVEAELNEIQLTGARLTDATGLQSALRGLRESAREVEEQFISQKLSALRLFESYDEGTISADRFIQKAESMLRNSQLLDDTDLSGLTAGIETAQRAMDQLNESTSNTLVGLQNELDRLQGNTDAIAQRQYQQRIQELEADLAYAEAFGDAENVKQSQESLRLAQQIYKIEESNRKEAQSERVRRSRENEAERAKEKASSRRGDSGQAASPGGQQVIELKAGNSSVSVSTDNPSGLLQLLEQAGLRTA